MAFFLKYFFNLSSYILTANSGPFLSEQFTFCTKTDSVEGKTCVVFEVERKVMRKLRNSGFWYKSNAYFFVSMLLVQVCSVCGE